MRATDEFDQAVWPETCSRCPVPGWVAAGICKHLDIGTEVGAKVGVESPRVFTACRFFGVRLDGLERCRTCPEFTAWDGQSQPGAAPEGMLAQSIPSEVLEQAVREALDRQVQRERVRMMPQCFRIGATQCLRSPRFAPNWVLVLPPASLRSAEPYRNLVGETLKRGGVEALFYTSPLRDVDSLCDLCLSVQQCPRIVVDVSEWDVAALLAMGLAGALGRQFLLLRGQDSTPPFAPQGLPIYEYTTGEDLATLLVQGLGLEIKAEAGEAQAQEGAEPGESQVQKGTGEIPPAEAGAEAPKAVSGKQVKRARKAHGGAS
jgi:hypothetical protein